MAIKMLLEVPVTAVARVHGTITVEVSKGDPRTAREIAQEALDESPHLVEWEISDCADEPDEGFLPDVWDAEAINDPRTSWYRVNVYLLDRAYGGPEEGGWWFNTSEFRADETREMLPDNLFLLRHNAEEAAEKLQERLDTELNAHRRSDVSSVTSEGRYVAKVETHEGRSWPQRRPRYC